MIANRSLILLVEDDENDVFFMERAMAKANLDSPIHVARDGQEALDYLAGNGRYADRSSYPLPRCIFLDLKLPFINGFEILEWIRNQPNLAHISVLILTSSPEECDRERAGQLGAKAYLVKPPTPQMLREALKSFPECDPNRVPVAGGTT
jgi:CheY-like chemotaxis protein